MAVCIPPAQTVSATSSAELRLYRALQDQLNDDYLVFHSVAWIAKPKGEGPRDGEVDFLICHPRYGILVIEVKGGRIDLDYGTRRWTSTDRSGAVHDIKNPFEQAKRGKFGILEKLKENPQWQRLAIGRFTLGHAVFLPDAEDGERLSGVDAPPEIIGDRNDLLAVSQWMDKVFTYWAMNPADDRRINHIGPGGIQVVRRIFARISSTLPLLSARLQDEERERVALTQQQAAILNYLSRQRRVMVAGGAGTGKTLIAREKAVRAAEEGLSTLLVCYNRGLADHLREQCVGIERLEVASFHQLCRRWIDKAKAELGRDLRAEARRDYPRGNEFDHHQPIALALAIDIFGPRYDAIIVDEAQDFGDEFWMPIEMMLSDPVDGLLYIFLDENQDIYGRSAAIPIDGEPMVLDRNCRNTVHIHAAAYRYYQGAAVRPSGIAGADVKCIIATPLDKQARAIATLITHLVAEGQVQPHDIGVLLCDPSAREACERALLANSVPNTAKWGRLEAYGHGSITVDTVARFKGLERAIIILWALDTC